MVKVHNVRVTIVNRSGLPMTYKSDWYNSGGLADTYEWPIYMEGNDKADILNYENNSGGGCSGYMEYEIDGTVITFSFSNPSSGKNKLGVAIGGKEVWDKMTDHDYKPFVEKITVSKGAELYFNCECTGGNTNHCTIAIFRA